MDAGNDKTVYRDVMNFIEYELAQQLNSPQLPRRPKPVVSAGSSSTFHHTAINIRQDEKGNHQLAVIAGDSPDYWPTLPTHWHATTSRCAMPRSIHWEHVLKILSG